MKKTLHLGCGNNKLKTKNEKIIGLDIVKLQGVDIVHNLDKTPWPIKDNEFDRIYAPHVIEHLHDTLPAVNEMWRITKKGAILDIAVPHFSSPCAFGDPTHKSYFSLMSFDYFTEKCDLNFYSSVRFKILEKKITITVPRLNFLSKFLTYLFNSKKGVYFYEAFLSRIVPIKEIIFKLETVK